MVQAVGMKDGKLIRDKADGTSGYWKEYALSPTVFRIIGGEPTPIDPDGNTIGGYQLDDVGEILEFITHMDEEWDEVSDIEVEVFFDIRAAGQAGPDTVDLQLDCFMKGVGDAATRNQTLEEATIVGTAAQWTAFKATFTLVHDDGGNPVNMGDTVAIKMNLETDTSEVDDITINYVEFKYRMRTPALLRD